MNEPNAVPKIALQENLIRRVNVGDMLTRSAARAPTHTALVEGPRRLSYRELNDWVNRSAHGLVALGYRPGDALGLMSGNCIEFLVTYFACAKIGVVCTPVNLFWRQGELSYVLTHAQVRGVVVQERYLGELAQALGDLPAVRDVILMAGSAGSDVSLPGHVDLISLVQLGESQPGTEPEMLIDDRAPLSYLYTSGTTSAPKGVVGNHLAIYLETLGVVIDLEMKARDRVVAMMPMFHTAQLNAFCTPTIASGATLYILEGFDAKILLDLIEAEQITITFGLPMMYRALLDEQQQRTRTVSSLRRAVYAMAPMPDDDLRRLIEVFGCELSLMFGQTEMSPASTCFRPEHQLSHPGAIGMPSINVQAGIMDERGELLPWGQSGEIVYRSPHLLTEYLRDQGASREAFKHGWFHSGDVGHFGQDGMLWFEDRHKDVIKSGGENIASIEVEKALYAVEPKLAEVVVVGLPHERWGEAVTAVVTLRSGETIDAEGVLVRLRQKLSPFKCPKAIIVVGEMPKTATGKIQKTKVRQNFADYFRADKRLASV